MLLREAVGFKPALPVRSLRRLVPGEDFESELAHPKGSSRPLGRLEEHRRHAHAAIPFVDEHVVDVEERSAGEGGEAFEAYDEPDELHRSLVDGEEHVRPGGPGTQLRHESAPGVLRERLLAAQRVAGVGVQQPHHRRGLVVGGSSEQVHLETADRPVPLRHGEAGSPPDQQNKRVNPDIQQCCACGLEGLIL